MFKDNPLQLAALIVSAVLYFFLGYAVSREQTALLLPAYVLLFVGYVNVAFTAEEQSVPMLIRISFVFRCIFLLAIPALSDDFYRFIWDGRLLAGGYNPFAHLPQFYLEGDVSVPGINQNLFDHLNSQHYFTVYPPLSQVIFYLAAVLSPGSILGSVVVMRLVILACEAAVLALLLKMTSHFQLPSKRVLLYAFNPLIILELTGNLHFEAFVIFFLLFALHFLLKEKIISSAGVFSLSVGVKLLPLIFLPAFITRLGWRNALLYFMVVGVVCVLLFSPLSLPSVWSGFGQSLGLYFKSFEFNASIYYVVREVGFSIKGYNIIADAGWKLGMVGACIILLVSLWPFRMRHSTISTRTKELIAVMMWSMTIYFLFTTTLHPWYITTLLALSLFTRYRFVVVWTALIFFTYAGYSKEGYMENLWLVAAEYVLVFGFLAWEFYQPKRVQSI